MPVVRRDLDSCIGCGNCFKICPVDVFRFDEETMKSIIAFPEGCQSCGMCYVNCLSDSIAIEGYTLSYSVAGWK